MLSDKLSTYSAAFCGPHNNGTKAFMTASTVIAMLGPLSLSADTINAVTDLKFMNNLSSACTSYSCVTQGFSSDMESTGQQRIAE